MPKEMQRQVSVLYEGIDSDSPTNQVLSAKYMKSFAYHTINNRLPVILTKVINELATNKNKIIEHYGNIAEEDLKSVIGQISKLKNELVTNKSLIKLCSKADDVEQWNNYLEFKINVENNLPCWYYSPWLFVECYMYRRLWEIFENSQTLQELDPFAGQKEDAFNISASQIKAIGKITLQTLSQITSSKESLKDKFIEYLKLSLWSNRCDLSLLNGTQLLEDATNLSNINTLDSYLLRDDSQKVYELLKTMTNNSIDFVNDNSSYEVFSDLCFCDILCTFSLASKIRFHVKKMPWFVSDTMKKDISWLLNKLENEGLEKLSERWRKYFQDGTWCVFDEKYWTLPFDYNDMKTRDSVLYNLLSESTLVIFKGDLNYRKLLGDINWDHCEKFEKALRDFRPTNILSLRTVKADIICGLTPEKCESLGLKDKMWMRTGEYALIQFYCQC